MTEYQRIQNFLEQYQRTGRFSMSEVKHIYRVLSKQTHPDISGKESDLFIRLQKAYEQAQLKGRQQSSLSTSGLRILDDLGYANAMPVKAIFYILIQQYFKRGTYRKKVYLNSNLYRKNREIIDAIQYWGGEYNEDFPRIFSDFRNSLNSILPLGDDTRRFIWAQRIMVKGILACSWYQEKGRNAHRIIASENLVTTAHIIGKIQDYRFPVRELNALRQFFLKEIGKESCRFTNYHGHWRKLQVL